VVEDLFVPRSRSFTRAELHAGRAADASGACHQVPLLAVNGISFAAPILGAARGALAGWSGSVGLRIAQAGRGGPGVGPTAYYLALARAAGEIDAAQLLIERAAAVADVPAGLTGLATARNLRDCTLAVEFLVSAVDQVFRHAGTHGLDRTSPLQRAWRDVHSAASHVALQFEPAATSYATTVLAGAGLPGPDVPGLPQRAPTSA
ncbi:MAG TPA: hypothetical protein VI248_16455, partial [Kineosporiaceae bacterium]